MYEALCFVKQTCFQQTSKIFQNIPRAKNILGKAASISEFHTNPNTKDQNIVSHITKSQPGS